MDDRNHPDAGTRDILLKEARALMAENANFSVKALLTSANVSRAQFRRFFSGKAELLSALAGEDVRELTEILEAVQPVAQSLKAAVGAPAQAVPATDAWLERRLRVFERALATMEKRQENTEQNFAREIALLGEKLDALAVHPAQEAPAPEIAAPEPAPEPAPVPEPEPQPKPESVTELAPAVLAHVEEIAGPDTVAAPSTEKPSEKISEKDISDFLAHARQAARNAALAEAASLPKARNTPWLAWSGAAAVFLLLLGLGLLLAGRALGHAAPPVAAGTSHRQVAGSGLARTIALAEAKKLNGVVST